MTVRTFAVGLLLSAHLLFRFQLTAVAYFQNVAANSPVTAFWLAMNTLSPQEAHVMGAEYYHLAIYIFMCLGTGMAIAGVLYPLIETGLREGLQLGLSSRGPTKIAAKSESSNE